MPADLTAARAHADEHDPWGMDATTNHLRDALTEVERLRAALERAALVAYAEADRCDKYSLPGAACVRVGDAIRRLEVPNAR